MKLLFTGRGGAGSWRIRGEQLGKVLGGVVKPNATLPDCKAADMIVCVKRTPTQVIEAIRASGKPWLLDVVDCWPQPAGNGWGRERAVEFLRSRLAELKPTAAIYATRAMQADANYPGFTLLHHGRPGLGRNPIRERVQTVAYEGRECYLGPWRALIQMQCKRRGWTFATNPPAITDADIVVAFRGAEWDGYACRHWKSNVKLANSQVTGTPFIGLPEAGYIETASGAEYLVDNAYQLSMAFEWLTPQDNRRAVSERLLTKAYTVQQAAEDFRCGVKSLFSRT